MRMFCSLPTVATYIHTYIQDFGVERLVLHIQLASIIQLRCKEIQTWIFKKLNISIIYLVITN